MDKKRFDSIFNESLVAFRESRKPEYLQNKLKEYVDTDDGKVSDQQLAMFAYIESFNDSVDLLYTVLSKLLEIDE